MKRPTSPPSSNRFTGRCDALKLFLFFRIQQHPLFVYQLWLGLGISIVCVIAILNLIQYYLEYRSSLETKFRTNDNQPTEKIIVTKGRSGKQFLYVFGNLLSQGFYNIAIFVFIERSQNFLK